MNCPLLEKDRNRCLQGENQHSWKAGVFCFLFFKEADNVEEAATAESQSCPGVGDESKERKDRRNGVRMREKTSLKGTE